jgi:hypothetical protein
MTSPAPRATTKNAIVELLLLALADSKLKDVGLPALRGVLQSDARLAVLDGAVELEAVWELLEAQPGWEPQAAYPPLCFVKALEPKLQIKVNLPKAMNGLDEAAVMKHAVECKPKRDDVDRIIHGKAWVVARKSGLLRTVAPPKPKEESDAGPMLPSRRKAILIGASVITVACLGIVAYSLLGTIVPTPKPASMETADFAGEIPLRAAHRWGAEVHAALSDPSWLQKPEGEQRRQLEVALQRLSDRQISVLIIEDDARRPKVTAQMFGKPPKLFVRTY